ncbi:MAG: hypothetical protein PVSMB7_24490 [Chloroflexota bacterium]
MTTLTGVQYVRLAPGAAEAVARFLNAQPSEIDELVLDLDSWPDEIHPMPRRARDGRLLAGDPILLDATEAGLVFARGSAGTSFVSDAVLVHWHDVRQMAILGSRQQDSAELISS